MFVKTVSIIFVQAFTYHPIEFNLLLLFSKRHLNSISLPFKLNNMSKRFRRQHQQQNGLTRIVTAGFIFIGLVALGLHFYNSYSDDYAIDEDIKIDTEDWYYLPTTKNGKIVLHNYYALSYDEKHEQAEWIAYELTKSSLRKKNVKRTNNFRPDPKVRTKSATDNDYRGSGYDRGHMAPAGDMAFNEEAMSETFYMSNISPQVRAFNQGIWRELEELIRDWAFRYKHLYVVTGPIFGNSKEHVGYNKVTIPVAYFKVLLDLADPDQKAIGFIIPNEVSYERLDKFATSVDEIEAQTGFDFFPELLEDKLEAELESQFDMKQWPTDEKKFKVRKDKWNNVR